MDQVDAVLSAIRDNRVEVVRELCMNDAQLVCVQTEFADLPIHVAAGRCHRETVELLVELGADVNSRNGSGATALHLVAECKDCSLLRFLIRSGADLELADRHGERTIHYAIQRGNLDATRILLEAGADPSSRAHGGWTSLHYAAYDGNVEIAKLLLQRGVKDSRDEDGLTAAYWAAEFETDRHRQIVSDIQAANGSLDIHTAIRMGDIDAVMACGDLRADPSYGDFLTSAIKSQSIPLVSFLLESGSDANASVFLDLPMNELIARKSSSSKALFNMLVEHGADVDNKKTKSGMSAREIAGLSGDPELKKLMNSQQE